MKQPIFEKLNFCISVDTLATQMLAAYSHPEAKICITTIEKLLTNVNHKKLERHIITQLYFTWNDKRQLLTNTGKYDKYLERQYLFILWVFCEWWSIGQSCETKQLLKEPQSSKCDCDWIYLWKLQNNIQS